MKKNSLLLYFFLSIIIKINAQDVDSLRIKPDSLAKSTPANGIGTDSILAKKKFVPVPKKALLYAIIPGGGQIYNRKLWFIKAPIVYAGFGAGGYLIASNRQNYRYLKQQYFNKVNKLEVVPNSRFPFIRNATADNIRQVRDGYYKNLQQSYVFTVVWYLLSGIEAFSAAHLMNFDISDDLTLQLKPIAQPLTTSQTSIGLGISISIR